MKSENFESKWSRVMRNAIPQYLSERRGGFFGDMIGWFIRVVIYDICVTTIQEVTGASRLVSIFIFLGILLVISFVGYLFKQKMSKGVDEA